MSTRARRYVFLSSGVALSAVFLYLSVRQVDVDDARREIVRVPWIALVVEPLIQATALFVLSLRSRLVFRSLHQFSTRQLFESVWLSFALNNVIPLRAGELARMGYLSRYGELPASTCLAAIGLERLLDLLVLFAIIAAALPFMATGLPLGASFYIAAAVVLLSLGGAVWVSRRPDWFVRATRAIAGVMGERPRRFVEEKSAAFADGLSSLGSAWVVLGVVLLTLFSWALALSVVQLWIWAFGLQVPWYAPVVVLAFLSFGLAIPSTPGHVGTFHFFASSALVYLGVVDVQAVSFAIVFHAMAVIPLTVLGIPLLFREYARLTRTRSRQRGDGGGLKVG